MGATYDLALLRRLTIRTSQRLPSHSDMIASVKDIQGIERNLGLTSLCGHELVTAIEGYAIDLDGTFVAFVPDDVDGGAVVDEIFRQGF
jgi:hypothetical protein